MARVNLTIPDAVVADAKAAGLNLSRIATAALADELDRLAKTAALDAYLADLDAQHGPPSDEEMAEARAWADRVLGPPDTREAPPSAPRRRRRTA